MVDFQNVARTHVLRALGEYDRRGADEFLSHHGFGRVREYVLLHDQKEYDPKAVLGVALQYAVGRQARSDEFSGGKEGAATVLEGLGFQVEYRGDALPTGVDAATVGSEKAREAWATAARDALLDTARRYHAVVTYKELSTAVMSASGITTRQLVHYWIGDVLGRVAADCEGRGEPLLSALCVNAQGSVGDSYADAVEAVRGARPEDPDQHAAEERLACYRAYAADLPEGGGAPALTAKLASSRDRTRRARRAERVIPVCPKCHMALPGTGVCDYCE
jgi:hypothetical protein